MTTKYVWVGGELWFKGTHNESEANDKMKNP